METEVLFQKFQILFYKILIQNFINFIFIKEYLILIFEQIICYFWTCQFSYYLSIIYQLNIDY